MVPKPELTLVIYKSTTGPHISCKARNLNVCLCMCCSNISADQDQTELRVSTWLLHGSRVCKVAFVWTTMIPLIIYFINALPISLALLTVATTVTCAPEPITAHCSHVHTRAQNHDNKWIYTCNGRSWTWILLVAQSLSVLCS